MVKQAVREAATICPAPCKLTFDLLTLKVVSESRVTCATFVPILVFLGLCSRLRPDVRDSNEGRSTSQLPSLHEIFNRYIFTDV